MSELLTVEQVATLLQISTDTAIRRFARVKGVIDIGTETPKRRRYRVLRIPRTIVEKWAIQHGGRILESIPAPLARTRERHATPKSGTQTVETTDAITRLTQDLALVATQHGADARKTLARIQSRAKTLTFLPQDQWQDVIWLDEEDERD
jgi:hypothetical protein